MSQWYWCWVIQTYGHWFCLGSSSDYCKPNYLHCTMCMSIFKIEHCYLLFYAKLSQLSSKKLCKIMTRCSHFVVILFERVCGRNEYFFSFDVGMKYLTNRTKDIYQKHNLPYLSIKKRYFFSYIHSYCTNGRLPYLFI